MTNYLETKTNPHLKSIVIRDPGPLFIEHFGEAYTTYRELWAKCGTGQEAPKFPIHLDLDFVDACNLRCRFCMEHERGWTGAKMNPELLTKILTEANQHESFYSLNLAPTTEAFYSPKEFIKTLDIIEEFERPLDIFLHTNAVGLKGKVVDRLLNSRATWICASMEGLSNEAYQEMCGVPIDAARDNLIAFVKARDAAGRVFPRVRLSMVVGPSNHHERDAFIEFWEPYVDIIEFQDIEATPAMMEGLPYRRLDPMPCSDPMRRMLIRPEGDVYPCCAFPPHRGEVQLGSVVERTIESIWQGSMLERLRKGMAGGNLKEFPSCHACINSHYEYSE